MVAALRAGLARLLPDVPGGPLPLALPRRRIYILPSRFGVVYAIALFCLQLGALNYNNNAAILLALLLAATALLSAVATVRFLASVEVIDFVAEEAFSGHSQTCRLRLRGRDGPVRGDLLLRVDEQLIQADCRRGEAEFVWVAPARARGRHRLGRIRLSTLYPLGLFRAWCLLEPAVDAIVYPAPESPAMPYATSHDRPGDRAQPGRGDEDWHALREFQRGDSLRDIAWKTSARHDRWLVAETRSATQAPTLYFSLSQVSGLARERGLSRLCRWILMAEAERRSYLLQIGDRAIGPGLGSEQRQRALTALADLP